MSSILSTKLFGMAKNAEYKIAGFPDFSAALVDLKQFQRSPQPTYEVTVPTGKGDLVIKQSLIDLWMTKHPDFADGMQKLLEEHNKEFNPEGLTRGADTEASSDNDDSGPPTKKLRLSTATTLAELEKQCPERTRVQQPDFNQHVQTKKHYVERS